jgi:hypothetical protein
MGPAKIALALLTAAQGWAQWIELPTRGVPLTADGKVNFAAPTPRQNGRPDFTGMWVAGNTQESCPNGLCVIQMPLPPTARNIGVGVEGGLPYNEATTELMRRRTIEASRNDPHVRCTPPNFPRAWALPQYKKIVQTPDVILVLHEFEAAYRQIFTDGRALPEINKPTWNGYSIARWDGDTLIVTSTGFRDDLWLDMLGNPLTDRASVTERISRPNYGTLVVEVTVNDPGAYTKPWTVHLDQSIVLNSEMMDEICTENEKSLIHLPK